MSSSPFSAAALHAPVSAIMETDVACVEDGYSIPDYAQRSRMRGEPESQ